MSECEHEFERFVGIRVFDDKGLAWVQLSFTHGGISELPQTWMCVKCGEQGYEVSEVPA